MQQIKNYEGVYSITKDGQVYRHSYARTNGKGGWYWVSGRYLKHRNSNQYYSIVLHKDNKRENKYIHRLIAETYIPNPSGYNCCNHKDGNKKNNNLGNLEWCTKSHDLIHKNRTGLQVNKITFEQAEEIREKYKRGVMQTELAEVYGISQPHVSDIVNNKKVKAIKEIYR